MKTSYIAIHLILLLIPTIYAKEQHEFEYFSFPSPNSVYKSGDSVKFSAEDVPDEGTTTSANLHRADGSFVKTLQSWSAEQIDMSDELFDFNWVVDVDESGSYYVEMVADESPDEVTRSYSFTIEADDEAGSLPDDTEEPQQPATTSFNDEEGGPEEEGGHGSSIHQVQSSEENNNEFQEEPEEIDEPSEHNNRKKLSLHNDQTKVAHIASHNDIDTVSDEPSNSMTHRPPPSQHQSAKIVTQQQEKTSSPNNLLTKVVDDVKHTAGLASNDNKHHQQKQPSHEKENPQEPQDLKVLHPPEINDNADMKTLMAADKQAIEQEKLWIQQSKNGGGPKKMILEGLTGSLGNNNKKTTTTTHHKSTTTTKTTTTHHKSIPKVGHQQEQNRR
ncbi:hypothetical protein BJ944DRAFT_45542 [Cunninghamella echinulata]|nr:hypothetical protein BJ944DRAFT_45542 [Cunninghamella echinulata]